MRGSSSFQGTKINPTRFHRSQIKFYLLLIPISIFMLLPVMFVISNAFKPIDELQRFPPTFIVERPSLNNFRYIMQVASGTGVPMSRFLLNTVAVTAVTLVATILITGMTAYALSKKKFRAKEWLFKVNQAALMFVPAAVGLPRYLVIINSGLNNNFMAHIVPFLAMPVGLFLVKQFVDTQVPDSLLEAARIDGAGEIKLMYKVVFPLIKPALATVMIITFQAVWGAVEPSTMFIEDDTLRTFAFYLGSLTAGGAPMMAGVGAAAGMIMFLPNLIIFIALQSRVMSTMSHSGIK
ncbi:MAG: carbohydrate ABC transporter permease [Defluviitaleaceae bacterium]|nr:carbohydrate ABC transporter permease [Defluviitaleaceae bacterium]